MLSELWFWREESIAAKTVSAVLSPLAWGYECGGVLRRRFTTPWRASVPVICVGNASLGGAGKTPFAMMLGELLKENGFTPHFLSRGYGGAVRGPVRVEPETHTAHDVGDEPLLLAKVAPTWVSQRKRDGAEAAINAGADIIVMDDGFQNPTIEKDFSILLNDGRRGYGNGKIFPAGPMRERYDSAKARADIIVEIKSSASAVGTVEAADFAAWLEPQNTIPQRVLAFCGIANPERFFETLECAGYDIADAIAFPDHYAYTVKNIEILKKRAKKLNAALITTEKDRVRIDADAQESISTLPVRMRISDPAAFLAAVTETIAKRG